MTLNIKKILITSGVIITCIASAIVLILLGVSQSTSIFLGFFLLLCIAFVRYFLGLHSYDQTQQRLDQLEKRIVALRAETAEDFIKFSRQIKKSDTRNDKIVSELKLLQTLLAQVMQKDIGFKIKASRTTKDKQEQIDKNSDPEIKRPKQILKNETENSQPAYDPDRDIILHTEVDAENIDTLEYPPSLAGAEQRIQSPSGLGKSSKTASIRVIKREDQLLAVIQNSLADNRVDLYLQGIVGLPSRRNTHYECFSRVRDQDGHIILPRHYIKLAETRGLIGTIDNLLLFRLIQLVRKLGRRKPDVRFFCNLSRHSMIDEEFFPQFIDFMQAHEEFSQRLIFEISQDDYLSLDTEIKKQLKRLGRRGFGFSLDHTRLLDSDILHMHKDHFQFIKSDIQTLAQEMEIKDIHNLVADLRQKGLSLIASRLENEDLVLKAVDAQIELGQGYLFGEPRAASDLDRDF